MWSCERFIVRTMGICVTIGIALFSCLFGTGLAINCYQCNSTSLDCLEKFMHPNPLQPESCGDTFEARYCIKTTGIYGGVLGTRRFCSDKDMGNECHFIPNDDDKREYKGCIYTCGSDGCNDGSLQLPMSIFVTIAISLAAIFIANVRRTAL